MSEVLTEIAGIRVTTKIASAGIAAVTLALFVLLWLTDRRKRTGKTASPGEWMNGAGYGMLPALAVWKAFEDMSRAGRGAVVTEPLPFVRWFTENGKFCPCRIELTAAAACFTGVTLWLILRRREPENQGDLLPVTLCLWSAVRIVTESFRPEPRNMIRYAYCAAILLCLAWWTVKRTRVSRGIVRTTTDWAAALLCTGIIAVTAEGILSVGSGIGDLAVTAGCAMLTCTLTLIAGSDCRKLTRTESF